MIQNTESRSIYCYSL